MGEFGWAYISGSNLSVAQGTDGSVQLREAGGTAFSGSSTLVFDTDANLKVTGSILVKGNISASAEISASAYWGDGSNLTGISSVSIDNDGANRVLTADGDGTMSAESNLTFDGSTMILTGTLNVSGTINANEYNINVTNQNVINLTATGSTKFGDTSDDIHEFTGSVSINGQLSSSVEISASAFYGDGSNLTGIASTLDDVTTNGNTTTNNISVGQITGSTLSLTGLTAGTATTSSFLALDSSNNIVLTSSAGGSGGTIGAAEDGDYTDGLFTDFTVSTPVGIPIDRFNEVLKILAPSPAPAVRSIDEDVTNGITAKLSFGATYPITNYTSSGTQAGFDAVDRSGSYASETSGSNIRLGIYDGTQDITGFINYDVIESVTNGNLAYSNDAFGNANEGTLKLELNGTVVHSVALSGLTGTGNPNSGSATSLTGDSGFTNISVTASSYDGNGSEWYIFKHRTAKYKIDANDQKVGWNYLRVIHSLTSDNSTNYIEWINDPSGAVDDLSVSNARIEDVTLNGSKYLSGVQYNTSVTASYKVDINNLYRNVYQASGTPISFTTTANATNPSAQGVEDIGISEDNTKILGVTASFTGSDATLFDDTMSCNVTVTHPLKATITNTGSVDVTGFLIETRDTASTNTIEYFNRENFRKTSGSYDTQASTTASAATWNSQTHMTGTNVDGHQDGLLFFNKRLYSPVDADIPNGGDFGTMLNVESGQPDYINDTPLGTRTFYRILSNSSGAELYNFKIESTLNGTTYSNSSLDTSNVHFFVKNPGTTGWMDISQNFVYGNIQDGDGAKIAAASDSDTHVVSFGTASVANGDRMMLKIVADETWGGYISQLQFTLPANQSQATPQVLSDINNGANGDDAKLSFGTSNTVADYSNATASSISLSDLDVNALYADLGSSNNRRGVFSSFPTVTGILNDAIGGGSGYPADAFFNGYSGSLVLKVNGIEVHEVSLTGTLNAISNDFNGNSSGFDLSAVNYSTLSSIPDYNKPYRTGTFQIGSGDQNNGWNYAQVIHRTSGDQQTNFIEWVVDPSGAVDDTAVSTPVLSNFDHSDVYYQSGIGYFASRPSASFEFTASNFYRNVYQNGTAITFPTTTNCSISNIRITGSGITTFNSAVSSCNMPLLNSSSNCHLTDIEITGTVLFDSLTSISGAYGTNSFTHYDVTVDSQVLHPFKSNRTTSQASKTSFMVYSGSNGSTTLADQEYFNTETYRIVSGNYATQAAVTSSSNAWNSQRSMNDGVSYPEYNDGMVTVNGYLIPPFSIGNLGDTRNVSDGGNLQAPSGNPDYSTSELSESVRTYYRYFRNTGVTTVQNFNIYVEGDASIVAKQGSVHYGALGANNRINIEMKVPGQTAWGDVAIPQGGVDPTSDGDGIFNGGNGNLDQDASNGSNIAITLGTLYWDTNDYIVLKISAHKDWTGYLTEVTASY